MDERRGNGMIHIKQTDIMHPAYMVSGRMFHQARGDSRPKVARMYTVSEKRDGTNMQMYLLTRYVTKLGVEMSAILEVEGTGYDMQLTEVRREDRAHEERMIMAWYQEKGCLDFGDEGDK
jgi:hypothetical protein